MQRKCLAAITCSVCCCFDEGLGWMLRVLCARRKGDSMRLEHWVLPSSMMPLTGLGFERQATWLLDVVSFELLRRKHWGSQFRVSFLHGDFLRLCPGSMLKGQILQRPSEMGLSACVSDSSGPSHVSAFALWDLSACSDRELVCACQE